MLPFLFCARYNVNDIFINMKHEIGELLIGKVENVKPYALFLAFPDGEKGLLHISEISDSYIRDIEKYGTVGDEIKVKVLSIDNHNGFMRVSLKQVPQEEQYSTHTNEKRHIPNISKESFKDLEERLPQWIEETLKKAEGEK